MPSPYSTANLPPAVLARLGLDALSSGDVTPEEAANNAAALGFSPYGSPDTRAKLADAGARNALSNQEQLLAQVAPQPQAKGSGGKDRVRTQVQDENRTRRQDILTLSQPQISEVAEGWRAQPEVRDAYQGLDRLDNLLAMEAQRPQPVDFKPLAALVDTWTGSKLASASPDVESPAKRSERIMNYANKLQQDRRDVMKGLVDAVGKSRAGTLEQLLTQKLMGERDQQFEDPSLKARTGGGGQDQRAQFSRDFERATEAPRKALQNAQGALATLWSGSKTAQQAFKFLMARASGEKGALSERDVNAFSGDPSAWNRIERIYTKSAKGELTDADKADLELLAQVYVKYWSGVLDQEQQYWVENKAPAYRGVGQDAGKLVGRGSKHDHNKPRPDSALKATTPAPTAPKAAPTGPAGLQGIDDYFNQKGGR